MKDLEKENARLRHAVSDLALDKLILHEAGRGNIRAARAEGAVSTTPECLHVAKVIAPVDQVGGVSRAATARKAS